MRPVILGFVAILWSCSVYRPMDSQEPDVQVSHVAYVAAEASRELSLDGDWQFLLLEKESENIDGAAVLKLSEQAASWSKITVPSTWELQGFAEPKYDRELHDAMAIYVREFEWYNKQTDETVVLQFDGVLYGFNVYLNGQEVGSYSSAYTRSQFDITDQLVVGTNKIVVSVVTKPQFWQFDINDAWSLSGVYRNVSIKTFPEVFVADLDVATEDIFDRLATIRMQAELAGRGYSDGEFGIRATLTRSGNVSAEVFVDTYDGDWILLEVEEPELWSSEYPNLYSLEVQVIDNGRVVQKLVEPIGIRKIDIVNGVLTVNGAAIKFRGINRHDVSPSGGRSMTRAELREDLVLIKAGNMNFIRTAHYPSDPMLYEIADELGLYIMNEIPFGRGDEYLDDPTVLPELKERALATVQRDKNHPSVIVWSLGNENPLTEQTLELGRYVKSLDPSRPICYPMMDSQFSRHREEIPKFVDIYAPHYPSLERLADYAENLRDRPVILTEFAHAMGLNFGYAEDIWDVVQNVPHMAGGAIWHFADQGILRKSPQAVDPLMATDVVWLDDTLYFDSAKDLGMDGIVYSNRVLQEDYYQLRQIYAPIKVRDPVLLERGSAANISVTVENLFAFKSNDGFQLNWKLLHGVDILEENRLMLVGPPSQSGQVQLPTNLSKNALETVTNLQVKIIGPGNEVVGSQSLRTGWSENVDSWSTSSKLDQGKYQVSIGQNDKILSIRSGETELVFQLAVRMGRIQTEADRRHQRISEEKGVDYHWDPYLLTASSVSEIERSWDGDRQETSIVAEFERRSVGHNDQSVIGEFHFIVSPVGIDVEYDLRSKGETDLTGVLLEGGVSLLLNRSFRDFRWIGDGPFAGYPGKSKLNSFGAFSLHQNDLYLQGNRTNVAVAGITSLDEHALVVVPLSKNNLAIERSAGSLVVSHNSIVSSRGTKQHRPIVLHKATNELTINGKFRIIPLDARQWNAELSGVLGFFEYVEAPFAPFKHSYDQVN